MDVTIHFGKYEILEELGRGGFGTVYKAEDQVLGRLVAIKILHPALVVEMNFIERFRQEARTAAMLDHSNLVPVYDFGETEGRYYIAMGYMPGGSLKDLLKREGKLEPKRAYEIMAQVCDGLEYAHARGIIHRDLKPGNILFDETDKARVADMGFAKVMSEGASRSMSTSGSLVGTPAYMAPETWRNKPATPQTDIYSLGCILYEMLTGKILFEGDSPAEVMTKHVVDGPQYVADLPQELRSVLDKALQQEPEQRFVGTKALLEAFKCSLGSGNFEQTIASEAKNVEETMKQGPWETANEYNELLLEESCCDLENSLDHKNRDGADNESELSQIETVIQLGNQRNSSIIKKAQTKFELSKRLIGVTVALVIVLFLVWILMYQKKVDSPEVIQAIQLTKTDTLLAINLPTEKVEALIQPSKTMENYIQSTATTVSPESDYFGSFIISRSNINQIVEIGRLGEGRINDVTYSPNGSLIAIASSTGIYLLDSETFVEKGHFGKDLTVKKIFWSSDGTMMASMIHTGGIMLWDLAKMEEVGFLIDDTWGIMDAAWSPDGKSLVSMDYNHDGIAIWNIERGDIEFVMYGHTDSVSCLTWSPDGKRLVSGSQDATMMMWDVDNRERVRTFYGHKEGIESVAWSPDGKRLASGSQDGTILIWDSYTKEILDKLVGHSSTVTRLIWSPDGKKLASLGDDELVNLWDLDNGEVLFTLEWATTWKNIIGWSSDGKLLATIGSDESIIFWNADSGELSIELMAHTGRVSDVDWSPDGSKIASVIGENVRIWDSTNEDRLSFHHENNPLVDNIDWSPNGKKLASGSWNTVILSNVTSGLPEQLIEGYDGWPYSVDWSPDGEQIACGSKDSVIISDSQSRAFVHVLNEHTGYVFGVSWSPTGSKLASAGSDGVIIIWNTETGKQVRTLNEHSNWINSVTWSPDGKKLASASDDETIIIWNAENGTKQLTLNSHKGFVSSTAWSPDGKLLASAGSDGVVIIWDAETGSQLRTLVGHSSSVYAIAWSPDGKTLASGSDDGTVRLWGIP